MLCLHAGLASTLECCFKISKRFSRDKLHSHCYISIDEHNSNTHFFKLPFMYAVSKLLYIPWFYVNDKFVEDDTP